MPRVTTGRHLTRLGRGGFASPPPDLSPQLSLVEGGLFLPTSRRGPTCRSRGTVDCCPRSPRKCGDNVLSAHLYVSTGASDQAKRASRGVPPCIAIAGERNVGSWCFFLRRACWSRPKRAKQVNRRSTGGPAGEHEICLRTSSTKTAAVAACERVHALLPVFCDFWVIGSVFG